MKKLQTRSHFLSGASLQNLVAVMYKNRAEIPLKYLPEIMLILITPLLLFPMHLCEILFYSGKIKRTRINNDPIFIIGHFRSGTTYMHNLLCKDRQFGFPTTYQCFVPGTFLTGKGFIKAIHKTTLPEKRPMDDVKLDSDFPQEEEFMISALSPYSYYQSYFFPRKMVEYFKRLSLLDQACERKWEKVYLFITRKISLTNDGRQLVLKNPVNTTRIHKLMNMFPNAKFIYLHRNADQVLRSTYKLFDKFLALYSFQNIAEDELKKNILWVYNQTMRHYEEQKKLIGKHHLVEVDYAVFINNPLKEMERIYAELELDGFQLARNEFKNYILEQESYIPGNVV